MWRLPYLLILLYRRVVSPWMPPVCRFHPSCSAYGAEAFRTHGFWRGLWLTVRRVTRCHPWHPGGVDPCRRGATGTPALPTLNPTRPATFRTTENWPMDRRPIIGFVLIFLIIIGYPMVMNKIYPPKPKALQEQTQTATPAGSEPATSESASREPATSEPATTRRRPRRPRRRRSTRPRFRTANR